MKIEQSAVHVLDSHGVGIHENFQILANDQAFRILSSGLYSDKISAVLREVGCNAADAHIAAKVAERAIEVKLPNTLDSEFYIQDWGTGLSHEDIIGLYTTYFSSNKGGNNEQTGAFGLGSKSPFSYTDSFAITTAYRGQQTSYSAYIGPSGSPVISRLASQPVSPEWPTGIRVSFPVAPKDIREFQSKAQQVFTWFAVKPVWPGESKSQYSAPDFKVQGSNFGFLTSLGAAAHRNSYSHHGEERARVLTGNVAYPLDAERLGSDSAVVKQLIAAGVHLRMPLGTVMPTASREELEYDVKTRANVVKVLKQAGREIALMLCAKVREPATGEWDRHNRARQFLELLPAQVSLHLDCFLDSLSLDSEELKQVLNYYNTKTKALPPWMSGEALPTVAGTPTRRSFNVWLVERETSGRSARGCRRWAVDYGKIYRGKRPVEACVEYSSQVEVVFGDAKHGYQRVQEYLATGKDVIILVEPAGEAAKPNLVAQAQKIALDLGGLPVVGASSLPFSKLATFVKYKKTTTKALKPAEKTRLYGEELIRYVDASTPEMQERELAFKDIPASARYYLPTPSERSPAAYGVMLPSKSERLIKELSLADIVKASQTLRSLGIPVREITGYVFPAGPQARKFKLRENGWQSLLDVIVEDLWKPEAIAGIGAHLNGMPYLHLDQGRRRYAYEEAGFLARLAEASGSDEGFKRWLLDLLPELPALAEFFNPLWEANVLTGANSTSDMACQVLLNVELLEETFEGKRLSTEAFLALVLKRYPESRFIQDENFVELWKEAPQAAAAMLRLIFTTVRQAT
jgi:hypothetical protein